MSLYYCKFFGCKSAWLIQDFIRNTDLANVMKRRGCGNHPDLLLAQGISVIFLLNQLAKQHFCDCLNVQHMKSALPIAELHYMREDIDHQLAAFFSLVNLIRNNTGHSALLSSQKYGIGRTA